MSGLTAWAMMITTWSVLCSLTNRGSSLVLPRARTTWVTRPLFFTGIVVNKALYLQAHVTAGLDLLYLL